MVDVDRRAVLRTGGAVATMLATGPLGAAAALGADPTGPGWEKEPMRWFQLAFTEDDPGRFDPGFWIDYFREIRADGVCLSAGGGIAFYPSKIPYHGISANMAGQDPFGDMVRGCRSIGMRILARIDPHAMPAGSFAAHPEWAACSADGKPRRHWTAPDLYLTCPYGPYNFEFMPKVIDEISTLYQVDGFFGNRWNTLGLCYCDSCQSQYRAATGRSVPLSADPIAEDGRMFARWSQARMLELMDLWNATIQRKRPGAFFTSGTERRGLVDYDGREIGERLPLVFCDRQGRSMDHALYTPGTQAWNSGRFAKELHAYMGDKPTGHIISVGVEEDYRWKDSVQAGPEIRIWAAGAIAHGSRPWITKFNAKPFDRRWMPVVSDLYNWHARAEPYLRNEANLARVGIVVSNRTGAYLGGAEHRLALEGHRRGYYQALLESRVPFDAIDDAYLEPDRLGRYRLLILPNAAVLSDRQCAQIRAYVLAGGAIVATHETSLYDERGSRRGDFALADLFGCHVAGDVETRVQNSYLTLRHPHPSLAGMRDVQRTIAAVKHVPVRADGVSDVPLTLVPSYPDLPMERVFTDRTSSDVPMAFCRTVGKGRVVYLPMDLDRSFDELQHGDHLALLSGMAAWAADVRHPLEIEGPGLVDVAYWRQKKSVAAHIINLNNAMTMRGSFRDPLPVGPYRLSLALPDGVLPKAVHLLESGKTVAGRMIDGRLVVEVPQVRYHEVVAVDLA